MTIHFASRLLACLLFATATTAQAVIHRVFPGDSIQAAIDMAAPGDTVLVEPGVYTTSAATDTDANARFGLRISTDNIRLIGRVAKGDGDAGKVILLPSEGQQTGVYAAPAACPPEFAVGECPDELQGFYIRGFTVKDFAWNGIQTRFVNNFEIVRNEAGGVGLNGIYPTISANGLVQNNVAYGTMDTALWVAASENVRVIGNKLSGSPIGLEVNVSVNVEVSQNEIYNNTVGVALFHPNSAGNLPRPDMGNWVVAKNDVYDNNLPNPAPPDSFQGALPSGVGILLLGVYDNVVTDNRVENNNFVGIGVLGWCSATLTIPRYNCFEKPPFIDGVFYDPSVNNNLIAKNQVWNNGLHPPTEPPFDLINFLAADLTYFSGAGPYESSSGNCFKKNKPVSLTFFSSEPDGQLPTDGCRRFR